MAKHAWSYQSHFMLTLQKAYDPCSRNTCFRKDEAFLGCCFLTLFQAAFWESLATFLAIFRKHLATVEARHELTNQLLERQKLIAAAKRANPLKYTSAQHQQLAIL